MGKDEEVQEKSHQANFMALILGDPGWGNTRFIWKSTYLSHNYQSLLIFFICREPPCLRHLDTDFFYQTTSSKLSLAGLYA